MNHEQPEQALTPDPLPQKYHITYPIRYDEGKYLFSVVLDRGFYRVTASQGLEGVRSSAQRKLKIEGITEVNYNFTVKNFHAYVLHTSPLYDIDDVWLRLVEMLEKHAHMLEIKECD